MKIGARALWAMTALLSIGAVGCSRTSQKPSQKNERLLRLNIMGEPITLDPRKEGHRHVQAITRMLFEGLTRISPDNEVVLGVADKMSVSEDKRTYTFHLRNSCWSNGLPVTAHDFEWAWKEMVRPDFDSPVSFAFYTIENAQAAKAGKVPVDSLGVRAVDDATLVVTLAYPAPYFPFLLANPIFSPICRTSVGDNSNWSHEAATYVCNGPFRVREWRHGEELVVEKNVHYWDADAVSLAGIRISMVPDDFTVLELFESGELDWVGEPLSELPCASLDMLREQGRLEAASSGGTLQLDFNTGAFPLNSTKLRAALVEAIDRDVLVTTVFQNGEQVAPSVVPACLSRIEQGVVTGDRDKARRLLSEALDELGLEKGELPTITLIFPPADYLKVIVQAMQQQWQDVLGVTIQLQELDWSTINARLQSSDVELVVHVWYSWYNDSLYPLEQVKEGKSWDYFNWDNREFHALLDLSDVETDVVRRAELLREAEEIVAAELPLAPLLAMTYKFLVREGLENVFISELGQVDFKWARFGDVRREDDGMCS